MNNNYHPPHKVKHRWGYIPHGAHFTLIPLDNYKSRSPLTLVVSGFSLLNTLVHFYPICIWNSPSLTYALPH